MLQNYFKIALRNLSRNRGYSLIHILGLSVGLACGILVFLYVQNELSYDRFQTNSDRLIEQMKTHTRRGGYNVAVAFTDELPPPEDLAPFKIGLFQEEELFSRYGDWQILEQNSGVLDPGGLWRNGSVGGRIVF